eukprot:15209036-Ditylum_brightwellii.AAC.1
MKKSVGELIPIGSNIGVTTIRGTDHKPEVIGTAKVPWMTKHSLHCLPEIAINNGVEGFKAYYIRFEEFVNNSIFHVHSSIAKCPPTCNHLKGVDFNKDLSDDFETMNLPTAQEEADILLDVDVAPWKDSS